MTLITKYDVDRAVPNWFGTLAWLEGCGWRVAHGPDITWHWSALSIELKESPHDNQPAGV